MLAIVAIPSVALLVVGACLSGYLLNQGIQTRTFADDVRGALGPTIRFIAGAQEERRLTILRLSTTGSGGQTRADLDDQRRQVDVALADMAATTRRLAAGAPDDLRSSLATFQRAADAVPGMRARVDSGQATPQDAYAFYDDLLALCGANIQGIARSAADATVGFEQMIAYDLFKSAEAMSRAHAMAVRAISSGLTPDQFHELAHQLGMYHEQVETLVPRMTSQERARYSALKTTNAWKTLVADDNFLMNHGPTPTGPAVVPFTIPDWEAAAHQVSDSLMGLYTSHSGYAADLGTASARRTLITSSAAGAAILLVVVTVLAVALRLSRRLIRRLTRLRDETLDLADRRLPTLVRRLGVGEPVDVEAEVPWLDHGEDEIGQVADAFNEAQRTAIAATVQEAETRQGVGAVFLNIAHRTQLIVHRQLKVLDEAERSLEDPDQLQMLFRLDHLATRSRRNAENLIILGGGQAGRQWRNPVPLRDAVRSAIAETEDYTRVNAVRLPDVPMVGAVVADLIHLLAELVDNATSFSPPQSQVEVRGNAVGRGVVVEIEDQGLGIEPDDLEQINAMLHHPPDFGVMALSTESRIGLFVVARLAARHGIKVTLRDSVYDGTRATVLIPSALIAETPEEPEAGGPRETASGARHLEPAWQRRPDPVDTAEPTAGSAAEPTPGSAAEPTAGSAAELASRTGTGRATRGADPQTVSLAGQLPAERDGDGASGNGHAVGPNGSAPGNGSPPPAGPATPRVSAQPPGGTRPRPAGPAPASRPTPPGGPRAERPPLPRRERQRNLAPQLLDDDAAEPAAADPGGAADEQGPRRTPEHSRSTMSAFQQGTRRARAGESEPVAPRRPGRSG